MQCHMSWDKTYCVILLSFEATLGFSKELLYTYLQVLLYRTCYIVVVVFLKKSRLSVESVMSEQFFKCQVICWGLSKVTGIKAQEVSYN